MADTSRSSLNHHHPLPPRRYIRDNMNAVSPSTTSRPYRSKSQRPCDRCRRRKTVCLIQAEGSSCQSCLKAQQPCAFEMPPTKRQRRTLDTQKRIETRDEQHGPGVASAEGVALHDTPTGLAGLAHRDVTTTVPVQSSPSATTPQAQSHRDLQYRDAHCTPTNPEAHAARILSAMETTGLPYASERRHRTHPHAGTPSNQTTTSYPVQYVRSFEQMEAATAQLCGMSAELDPWLLRHCKFDEYGMRGLQNITCRNVGGVPVQGLVPVHFIVTDNSLIQQDEHRSSDESRRRRMLEDLVPMSHGVRLISLFMRFVQPMLPIVSRSQLDRQLSENTVPAVLLAAVYASAIPYIAHDHVLFALPAMSDSLAETLWGMVVDWIQCDAHKPKLAIMQASLLYLQRLPLRPHRVLADTAARSSFLGSTVALAMSLGLQLESQPWGIPTWEKRLRRRLWWALYMEDKWTGLLMGRPPMIQKDEWDIFDLKEADLELGHRASFDVESDPNTSQDGVIFVFFVQLAGQVEKIQEAFYTLRASQRLAEDFRASVDAARPIRESLQAWYYSLPEELRLRSRAEGQSYRDHRQGVAVLHFSYLMLELFLYRAILRPLARSPPPPPVTNEEDESDSQSDPFFAHGLSSTWLLDDLTFESLEFDQLPDAGFAEFGEAAEVALNAAERCAAILVNFVASLVPQDFDVHWYPWTRICFATITSFITLLFVQAPTSAHAARSRELLKRWSLHLRSQHKTNEGLMTLGLLRLHSLQVEELDGLFSLSPSALELLSESRTKHGHVACEGAT
ncbi:fungal-specific transcription factor domain-containing protein [Emericellopsis atlantica]|uniref:Fungal-specific transcription factor domain-containing protein n=1 Tax=Emericellopsis atlantica TaxID=2614577 RepID=A0A9P7ZIA0_9HYPO|nr:fungal-specific transcription factor domain-containing protein [Emericellopsis atlantica]KAG9252292.1 fungal-specific transcription factor domain-containing protein [Emericellopsis atlantica]